MLTWDEVNKNICHNNSSRLCRELGISRSTYYRYVQKCEPVRLTPEEHFSLLKMLEPQLKLDQLVEYFKLLQKNFE